jgi:pyruvate/2-oxoacid:ferredoxin oxidoreductase beta subunit
VASVVRAELDARGGRDVVVMAWAGDGGTFDIRIQSLSGLAERNEDVLYVCYDNEAYMNTGNQRLSATPPGAWTTTTPKVAVKRESKKDTVRILLGHHVPYVGTASAACPDDLVWKFRKMRGVQGTRFIHVLCLCPPGWRIDSGKSVEVARRATQSGVFPIYEVEEGRFTINVPLDNSVSVRDYLKSQGRFREMDDAKMDEVEGQVCTGWYELADEAARRTGPIHALSPEGHGFRGPSGENRSAPASGRVRSLRFG